MSLAIQYSDIYGNQGVILRDPGTLLTDRFLLDTCTATFTVRRDQYLQLPQVNSPHPIFSYILMEKRELSFEGNWAVAKCSYAGILKDTIPVYETCIGLSQEAVETHPKFVTEIAGTAKAPLNGAVFKHIGQDGNVDNIATAENPEPTSNANYVFKEFQLFAGDILNEFAKIEDYMDASQITYRETKNQISTTVSKGNAGKIDTPRGTPPILDSGQNWLHMGVSATTRGGATQIVTDWRASGRRGWNKIIYGS